MNREEFREDVRKRLFNPEILAVIGMSKPNIGMGFIESGEESAQRSKNLMDMLYSDPPEGGVGEKEDTAV